MAFLSGVHAKYRPDNRSHTRQHLFWRVLDEAEATPLAMKRPWLIG
jgi:hypothetical protein